MIPGRAGLALVVSLLGTQPLSAQPTRYTLTDLGPGAAIGVNNAGVAVGSRNGQAVLWNAQEPTVLWGEVGGVSAARRINNTGQVVGILNNGRCKDVPCFPELAIWDNGALVDIPSRFNIPAPVTYSADVNDDGLIATDALLFDLHANSSRPYVDAPDVGFIGTSINNSGAVAGRRYGLSFEIQLAAVWTADHGGTVTPIDYPDATSSNAADLCDNSIVVGLAIDSGGLAHPFSWHDGVFTDLHPRCIDNFADPLAVNSAGTIVGNACGRALVWFGSHAFDLADLVAGENRLLLLGASDISNTGFIVGEAVTDSGDPHAFLLSPIACAADWNGSGALASDDFFAFVTDFFAGRADFDFSGDTTTEDFFAYLSAFFTGCP